MKHFVKDIQSIFDKKLSLELRGLLITIILLNDPDSSIHLAKVKAKVKFSKHVKTLLIELHEMELIQWSGYKAAKKSVLEKAEDTNVFIAIDFMNKLYKRKFDHTAEGTVKNLRNRLIEYGLETILLVISNRYAVWKDDSFMNKYLEPTTIFRASKFPKYLEEALRTKEGSSYVNANDIGLKNGDLITLESSQNFIDNDTYQYRFVRIEGFKKTPGEIYKKYGKDIKRDLKQQKSRIEMGEPKNFEYYYYIS